MSMDVQRKKVILVTEDDPAMLRALTDTLTRAAFSVLSAEDGMEGIALAKKEHPDAIILDILMPKMDGLTMMKMLRSDEWGKNVPIIILTNLDTNNEMIRSILQDQPAYYFLKSNITLEELTEKVKDLLSESAV